MRGKHNTNTQLAVLTVKWLDEMQPHLQPLPRRSLVHQHVDNGLQAGREAQHNGAKQRAPAGGHKLRRCGEAAM